MNKIDFNNLGLSEEILRALDKLGYKTPSDVQKKVIPVVLEDKDIIVKSQTGSGKTAAFGIPICEKIEIENRTPQVLVLTPTRELAVQVKEDISNIGRFKRIRCAAVFGKQPMSVQIRELRQRVHIIVGTPGRTLDHIERGNVDLGDIKYLVIDEADEMLNMGFIDQVEAVIKALPSDRVTMLFSATMPEEIERLSNQYIINPIKIEINPKNLTTEKIQQFYYDVEENKKFSLLNKLIYTERPDSCIIFCSTKDGVDNLTQKMKNNGYLCSGLHGGMEQKDRLDTIERFKRGEFRFLVATDVAARGIHIEDITHVINYDVPVEKESYVHRIGRTGRAGNKGIAITFVVPYEYRLFTGIEEYVNYKIPKREAPSEEEVEQGKKIFNEIVKNKPKPKSIKSTELNREITKIHINAGKKKKIRVGDIVGAITSIEGINAEDVGVIDIQDNFSYVDILGKKGSIVLNALKDATIKGKKVKVQKAKK
ncbi:ATP-dependent RNA helicase DbpA [Clostridium polyendosporum]|uniref:ATP-dependent RNA helicase DbpA n=1 Tax=Clostridium polyendosporum TaxID=69208 RepID=A0A919S1S4_9CLOT|nr:DEAD/DEAH box helicase [Clostridium polyendosporum]GIM30202.1 ATP-dependent RNA helicase DbpA [Clostridium polyendosporum]